MKRLYESLIRDHFRQFRQMVFLAGPRQVGKTRASLLVGEKEGELCTYLNWDDEKSRELLQQGGGAVAHFADLLATHKKKPLLIFDEIHKWGRWKQFLKGFFDLFGDRCRILVTGSAKLDIYKRTGDSLMGRYFLYRAHPLSVGELLRQTVSEELIRPPKRLSKRKFDQLLTFGGFPEPFLEASTRFSANWQRMRQAQLVREDVRDLSQVQELAQLDLLATTLRACAGKQVSLTTLAQMVRVSVPTISRWLATLEAFFYCFSVRPWTKNVSRSLRKEPKYFLWDWAQVKDPGARMENMVASHLLKAVHYWTDYGLGTFGLHYLRDKEKREVDFLVTRDDEPWFLVEVKGGDNSGIGQALYHFQKQTGTPHAFQVSFGRHFVEKDCFSYTTPVIVPATTFLSQLI